MKAGTEDKKKVAVLAAVGLVLVYLIYSNFIAGSSSNTPRAAVPSVSGPTSSSGAEPGRVPVPRAGRTRSDEFHPVLHSKRPEDQIDPMTVDPTLRLDLLAKLQEVGAAGSGRNLFQVSAAPPKKAELPKGPEPKVLPATPAKAADETPPAPPGPPPLPPISFKYYGFSTVRKDGKQAAFFLDGEDILIKAVGEIVKGNYLLVRIGQTSAVVEDTQSKRQQTVPLAEEAQG
jgi:hypothetical protein